MDSVDGDILSQRAWAAQSVLRKPCGWKMLEVCFVVSSVCVGLTADN